MPSTLVASAKERAATAWASSAAIGQEGGDSFAITPFTYWSTATALTALREPGSLLVGTTSSAPRYALPSIRIVPGPAARSRGPQLARDRPPPLRSRTVPPTRWAA